MSTHFMCKAPQPALHKNSHANRKSPPESGGVARSAGVVPERLLARLRSRNHPPRDPLRDPAALLTQEGNLGCAPSAGEIFRGISTDCWA